MKIEEEYYQETETQRQLQEDYDQILDRYTKVNQKENYKQQKFLQLNHKSLITGENIDTLKEKFEQNSKRLRIKYNKKLERI